MLLQDNYYCDITTWNSLKASFIIEIIYVIGTIIYTYMYKFYIQKFNFYIYHLAIFSYCYKLALCVRGLFQSGEVATPDYLAYM